MVHVEGLSLRAVAHHYHVGHSTIVRALERRIRIHLRVCVGVEPTADGAAPLLSTGASLRSSRGRRRSGPRRLQLFLDAIRAQP